MTIVAHAHPFVIGVDTHARTHALSVLVAATGAVVDEAQFPTTQAGMARAVQWAARRTGGDTDALWVVECAGSYGAGLARTATEAGYQVAEAARMDSRTWRGVGKSDLLDARRIATSVLALDTDRLRRPRADDGVRAALRVLVAARDQMTSERTASTNALTALLRTVDLGTDARRPLTRTQVLQVSRWRTRTEPVAAATARAEAVRLARRTVALDAQLTDNASTMDDLVRRSPARALLDKTGIGPVTAAVAMTAWSHPGRLRDEAAFASLAGTNPVPASSGNTTRHRLNRGGDRRLNRALHAATITRMRCDPATRAYVQRRRAEGLTTREIRRILKRYLTRQIYRTLNATAQTTPTPA